MPSAKGKKPLTKAEKEKKKREQEELRRQQEEEERVRQEQEDRERRKREKTEAEERRRQEKEEQKVRVVELAELRTMLQSFEESRRAQERERRQQQRWQRYLRCDGSPDPTVLPQVNTFILVWRDDSKRVLIDDVLQDSKLCLSLIQELEDHLEDDEEELDAATAEQYRGTVRDLQQVLAQKLERAAYEMLRRGVQLADSETANLQSTWRSDAITLCLWGNLSKNPRIRSFEFAEAGVSFDIPKALTKVGCAYQFLLTSFDHYSPQSPSFRAVPVGREAPEQQAAEEPQEEEQQEAEEAPEEAPKEEEEEAAPAREPTMDLMAELQRADGEEQEQEQEPEQEQEEELETPEEDLRQSPPPLEFEDFDGEEDAMDLRAYHTIGPIVNFSILQVPPQPVEHRGWTIIQHQEPPQPISFDYRPEPIVRKDAEEAEEADSNTVTDAASTVTASQAAAKKQPEPDNPPLSVALKLPATVFFAEEPKVARWDAERLEWRTDGIEVTKFDEEGRSLQFRTSVFGALALLQDFHINMPFQTWELRPLGTRSCQLTVVASINEVVLQVKDGEACVAASAQTERPDPPLEAEALGKQELAHLEGRWMSVRDLVRSLRAAGVNIFPREDSFKHVDVPDKSRVAEEMLYEQMALLSPAFAFGWSRWNADCQDRDCLLLQACEHLDDSPVNEDDFSLFSFTRRRVRRLKMREFDEEFSPEVDDSVAFHADFYHLLQEVGTDQAKARIDEVDFTYLATVRHLLQATRLLVFA